MRKNPSYTALLGPTRLLISEKSVAYTINWSYTIIWQVRVGTIHKRRLPKGEGGGYKKYPKRTRSLVDLRRQKI